MTCLSAILHNAECLANLMGHISLEKAWLISYEQKKYCHSYIEGRPGEVDALLEESKTETDVQARMDKLNQAEQIVLDDGAFVPLQCRQQHYLLNEKVTGMNFYFCSVNIDFVYADITE